MKTTVRLATLTEAFLDVLVYDLSRKDDILQALKNAKFDMDTMVDYILENSKGYKLIDSKIRPNFDLPDDGYYFFIIN